MSDETRMREILAEECKKAGYNALAWATRQRFETEQGVPLPIVLAAMSRLSPPSSEAGDLVKEADSLRDLAKILRAKHGESNITASYLEGAAATIERMRERDWQPIETAPKDGTGVLITNGAHCVCARWDFGDEEWIYAVTEVEIPGAKPGTFFCSYFAAPTHWQPLPAPPARSALAQKETKT